MRKVAKNDRKPTRTVTESDIKVAKNDINVTKGLWESFYKTNCKLKTYRRITN